MADRDEPEQEKRCIGQCHPRKRDMRARKCGESRGSPPAPGPNVRRDNQAATGIVRVPAHNRHENRREVVDSKHQVRESNEHRKPRRSVRDDRRIDAGQSAAATRLQSPASA